MRATTFSITAASDAAKLVTGGPTLLFEQGKVLVADLSDISAPSREEVTSILNAEREQTGDDKVVPIPIPLGMALRRHFLDTLGRAVAHGDFTSQADFWDVFDLVMALGVKATELAVILECRPEMISRYRNRKSAPPTSVMRRAVLAEALKMAKAEAAALTQAA